MADFVLCPSTFVKNSVPRETVARDNVQVIPFGIDLESWGIGNGTKQPTFLYVGNVSVRKGVHRLLVAWKKLRAYRTHRLKLIGEMQLAEAFLREFRGMYDWIDRVPRDELRNRYQSAECLVFNALADGFGHVFAEAMACGTAGPVPRRIQALPM